MLRDVVVRKICSPPDPVPSNEPVIVPKLRNIMVCFGNYPSLKFVGDFSGIPCIEEHSSSGGLNVFLQHRILFRWFRTKSITVFCQHLIRI